MSHVIDASSLNISTKSITTCYWIPVSDLIVIQCNGNCQTSPTQAPSKRPIKIPQKQPMHQQTTQPRTLQSIQQ